MLKFIGACLLVLAAMAAVGCADTQQQAATIVADATVVSTDVLDAAVNNPASTPAQIKTYAQECLTLCNDANAHCAAYGQFDPNKLGAYIAWGFQELIALEPYLAELIGVFGDPHSTPQQHALARQHFTTAHRLFKAAHPIPAK
jgi:hypothetical protein